MSGLATGQEAAISVVAYGRRAAAEGLMPGKSRRWRDGDIPRYGGRCGNRQTQLCRRHGREAGQREAFDAGFARILAVVQRMIDAVSDYGQLRQQQCEGQQRDTGDCSHRAGYSHGGCAGGLLNTTTRSPSIRL